MSEEYRQLDQRIRDLGVNCLKGQEAAAVAIAALQATVQEKDRGVFTHFAERDRRYGEHFTSLQRETEMSLLSTQRAVDKAEVQQQIHNRAQNEWRGQLKDQTGTFITRKEVESALDQARLLHDRDAQETRDQRDRLYQQIAALQDVQSRGAGRDDQQEKNSDALYKRLAITMSTAIGVTGLVITIVLFVALRVSG